MHWRHRSLSKKQVCVGDLSYTLISIKTMNTFIHIFNLQCPGIFTEEFLLFLTENHTASMYMDMDLPQSLAAVCKKTCFQGSGH